MILLTGYSTLSVLPLRNSLVAEVQELFANVPLSIFNFGVYFICGPRTRVDGHCAMDAVFVDREGTYCVLDDSGRCTRFQ